MNGNTLAIIGIARLRSAPMQARHFADFAVGQSIVRTVPITKEMIAVYADVVDDHNPLHTDVEFATSRFGGIIAHGTLIIGLFSATMYALLGPGAVARKFKCKFRAAVRPGDEVRIELSISDLVARVRKVVVEGKAYVGSTLVVTATIEALCEA
jgi:acyl dehydratase